MQNGQRDELSGQENVIWYHKFPMMRPVHGKLTRHDARELERIPKAGQHCVQEHTGRKSSAEDDHGAGLLLHLWTQTGVDRL